MEFDWGELKKDLKLAKSWQVANSLIRSIKDHDLTGNAERQGITEQLKAVDQMEWVGRMNNIPNSAMEIINHDLIYR